MRKLAQLDDAGQASTLSDVLVARGVHNDVRDEDGAFDLWVHDDARIDEARAALHEFRAEPAAARFREEAKRGRALRREADRADARYRERVQLAQREMYGADARGWVTMALMAASLGVALVSGLGSHVERISTLFLTFQPTAAMLPELRAGQVWRLFTPIVVHFGVIHLLFNLSMWWRFAQAIEIDRGTRFFVVFVAVGAAVTNLSEFAWQFVSHPRGMALTGGLSGVLYGLFGYAWTRGRIDPTSRIGVDDGTRNTLLVWLLVCMTGVFGNIANAAHLSGLVFGVAWAYGDRMVFQLRKRGGR